MSRPAAKLPATPFWSIKQAAAYIGVHPWTLSRFLQPKRKAKCLKVDPPPYRRITDKLVLIPIEEFKQWASGKKESDLV